jgi:hypothetical protein
MKKLKIIFTLYLGAFVYSCDSKTYDEVRPATTPIVAGFKPSYERDFKPVLTANCISCHSATGRNVSPYLDTYALAKTRTQNNLICRIEGSCGTLMPKGGSKLPQETIDMIKLWKAQGYLEK